MANPCTTKANKMKLRKIFESLTLKESENSFYGCIFPLSKVAQWSAHLPFKITSTSNGSRAEVTRFTDLYFIILSAILAIFVVHAHFTMHVHHLSHLNPMIVQVILVQVRIIAITAALVSVISFVKRRELVEVGGNNFMKKCLNSCISSFLQG